MSFVDWDDVEEAFPTDQPSGRPQFLLQLRHDVEYLLKREAAHFDDDFVMEAILAEDSTGDMPTDPGEIDPERVIAIFGDDLGGWTHVSGAYTQFDRYDRPCVAAAGMGEDAVFQTAIDIEPGDDWAIVAELSGEINGVDGGSIVSEGPGHTGISLWCTSGFGSPGTIRSQGIGGNNPWAGLDAILTLRVDHVAGTSTIWWWGYTVASGPSTGALGSGTLTVTVPRGQAIYGITILKGA